MAGRFSHARRWIALLAALLAVAVVPAVLSAPAGQAATGDNISSIIADRTGTQCASYDATGNHGSVGVGIAFNGSNLLISCYSDNTVVEIDPTDGSQVEIHRIQGASALGALAWDHGRKVLWACSNFGQVGAIDLDTDQYTGVFESGGVSGCFDGLAYDASDDSIWTSGDVSTHIGHFSTAGALVGSHTVSLGGHGNSGIAVGGEKLYMANNGGQQIYEVPKDFTSTTYFAGFDRRLEDLECDNVTFKSQGKAAMWVIDAYDNLLNAFEIPDGSCSFGGGGTDCIEDGVDALAETPAGGVASGVVHEQVEPAVAGVDPAHGETVHSLNCSVVVPIEDLVDGGPPEPPGPPEAPDTPSLPTLGLTGPFSEGFEGDASGWTVAGGVWEVGAPTSGPGAAAEGSKVAATVLGGSYPNNAHASLISPAIEVPSAAPLSGVSEVTAASLTFQSWFSTEGYYDCGVVELSTDGGSSWTQVTPVEGYPRQSWAYCGGIGAWTSFSGYDGGVWKTYTLDLADHIGSTVHVRFRFGSDGSVAGPGWYVDDLELALA